MLWWCGVLGACRSERGRLGSLAVPVSDVDKPPATPGVACRVDLRSHRGAFTSAVVDQCVTD